MSKALFFRKCLNDTEYFNNYNKLSSFGSWLTFKIAKKIILSSNTYNKFTSNFLVSQQFIESNLDLMFMDEFDCVSCLFITTNNKEGFLVYSAGYSYARYVAFINIQKQLQF